MGVHHYQLMLLPAESAARELGSDDVWEAEDVWAAGQPPSALLDELRRLLIRETSWGEVEEFESANDWGSDLRIWHVGNLAGPVWSIVFRFAPVADSREVLERFLIAAERYELLVYSRASARVLPPKIEIVEQDLKQSGAYRFASDARAAIVEAAATVKVPKVE